MIESGRSNTARAANTASEKCLQRAGDPLEQRADKAPLPDKKFLFQRRSYRVPAPKASKITANCCEVCRVRGAAFIRSAAMT